MNPLSRVFLLLGAVFILLGLLWPIGARHLHLGKLPGDIMIARGNTKFYFPLVTCLAASLVLTLLVALLRLLRK